MARQMVRTGDHDPANRGLFDAGPANGLARGGSAWRHYSHHRGTYPLFGGFPLCMYVRGEALDLLFNRLGQGLPLGRHPVIDRGAHVPPPPVM
jgi:hypothetical protein